MLSLVAVLALALAGDAAPPPTPDDLKVSEGHFNQGEAYYRAGEWSKARTEFQASYEISHLDLLLFNIAQTYIKEGDTVKGIAALKAYLKTTPGDADAQAKLASLEAALPQSAQAPPTQTPAPPTQTQAPLPSQTPRPTRKLLLLPLAIGAATTGAGLVLLGVTASAARDIETQPRTQLDLDAALARRDKLELGAILTVASGALVLGGTALAYGFWKQR